MFSDRPLNEDPVSRMRLQTSVRLRWIAVLGQFIAVAFVFFGLGFDLPLGLCLALIASSAWLNLYLSLRFPPRHRVAVPLAIALQGFDVIQLAALLFLTGGINNPFALLIVAPVVVSAASLPPRATLWLAGLALLSVLLLTLVRMPLPWSQPGEFELPELYRWGVAASIFCAVLFMSLYAWRLSKEARQMAAALTATEHVLAREQKLHALDGLAAAAAHELGTPLGTIVVVAKELQREIDKRDAIADDLALLHSQAQRCKEILQTLTKSPKETDPMHATLSVSQMIQEAVSPYQKFDKTIAINARPAEAAAGTALAEPKGLRRPGVIFGLGNLVENATDFARSRVAIRAQWNENEVTVVIADDGPGFANEIMESLGEPYITTRSAHAKAKHRNDNGTIKLGGGKPGGGKPGGGKAGGGKAGGAPTGAGKAGGGLGLGFFIAKTLLERSGAEITLSNAPPPQTGAIVRVSWSRPAFQGDLVDTLTPDAFSMALPSTLLGVGR
ncbi:MAG: ActS/PrrB/RegB family redox-sensitive histidine kinase [Pseudomonadota bacterium]